MYILHLIFQAKSNTINNFEKSGGSIGSIWFSLSMIFKSSSLVQHLVQQFFASFSALLCQR
jgi:hypothetical protein